MGSLARWRRQKTRRALYKWVLWLKQGPFIHSSKAIMPRARQQLIYLSGDLKNAEAAAAAWWKEMRADKSHSTMGEWRWGANPHSNRRNFLPAAPKINRATLCVTHIHCKLARTALVNQNKWISGFQTLKQCCAALKLLRWTFDADFREIIQLTHAIDTKTSAQANFRLPFCANN
jgi:hypothetical protein